MHRKNEGPGHILTPMLKLVNTKKHRKSPRVWVVREASTPGLKGVRDRSA